MSGWISTFVLNKHWFHYGITKTNHINTDKNAPKPCHHFPLVETFTCGKCSQTGIENFLQCIMVIQLAIIKTFWFDFKRGKSLAHLIFLTAVTTRIGDFLPLGFSQWMCWLKTLFFEQKLCCSLNWMIAGRNKAWNILKKSICWMCVCVGPCKSVYLCPSVCTLFLPYSCVVLDVWGIEGLWVTASSWVHMFAAVDPVHYG